MAESVILNEAELLKARNRMVNYMEFLSRKYADFVSILSQVQKDAFIDNMVSAQLTLLVEHTKPSFSAAFDVIDSDVKKSISKTLSDVAAADDFDYPASIMDAVKSILGAFF